MIIVLIILDSNFYAYLFAQISKQIRKFDTPDKIQHFNHSFTRQTIFRLL